MVKGMLFSIAALASIARGEPPATSWSCSVETLVKGKECVFEADAPGGASKDQQAQNVLFVRDLAPDLCKRGLATSRRRSDPTALKLCIQRVNRSAEACGLGGSTPIVDEKGRFAPAGKGCYLAISSALQSTSTLEATAANCCSCLFAFSCSRASDSCLDEVLSASADPTQSECAQKNCSGECLPMFEVTP